MLWVGPYFLVDLVLGGTTFRGVVGGIAPKIGSNSHPLTPLGGLAASTQDHGMCPSIGQCVGALWHSKDDILAQIYS